MANIGYKYVENLFLLYYVYTTYLGGFYYSKCLVMSFVLALCLGYSDVKAKICCYNVRGLADQKRELMSFSG